MSSFLSKLSGSIFCLAACLTPTWFYLGVRSILSPEGFWQEFFLMGVGVYLLGFFQVVLVIAFISLIVIIWGNPSHSRARA